VVGALVVRFFRAGRMMYEYILLFAVTSWPLTIFSFLSHHTVIVTSLKWAGGRAGEKSLSVCT
jgi:hypothetical protein